MTNKKALWPEAQWAVEEYYANPTYPVAILSTAPAVLLFLVLSWGIHALTGVDWPAIVLAILGSFHLVQGLPTSVRRELSKNEQVRTREFAIPLLIARTLMLVPLAVVYVIFLEFPSLSVSRWILLIAVIVIVIPLMWMSSIYIRQAGLFLLLDLIPLSKGGIVVLMSIIDFTLLGVGAAAWFDLNGIHMSVAIGLAVMALLWHVVNIMFFRTVSARVGWP